MKSRVASDVITATRRLAKGTHRAPIPVVPAIVTNCDPPVGVLTERDVAYIAHDLNAPLSIIGLHTTLLAENVDDLQSIDVARVLRVIELNVHFMTRVICDLVELSRITDGKIPVQRKPVELTALLKRVVERATSIRDRSRVVLTHGEPITVAADALRIERVLTNLLSNAVKLAPQTSRIDVAIESRDGFARISVRDAGPGIPPDELATVFDRHTRGERSRTYDGAGLGLFVSRQIIDAHGGRIGVDSLVDEGACFFFELPIEACE